jgi:CubicO group peptidase (beta-lactamase class C family)
VRVRAFQNPAEVIRVVAEVLQPGLVRIDSTNVAALTIELPSALRGSAQKLRVVWNGQNHELNAANGGELGSIPAASKLAKRAGLEGPMPAVVATPFAVVVGTTSPDPRMREIIQGRADFFAQQWLNWQHQPLRILKDTEVTAEHEKTHSLVLLGGADANAITRKLARKLPFEASRTEIRVDGRTWKLKDSVLQAIYPSPLAADRYVYVVAATSPEGMYFWKPQLVNFAVGFPLTVMDWIIQDGRLPPPGTPLASFTHVAGGVFDGSWRRNDRWSVSRDPKSANWTLRRAPPKDFAPSAEALQAVAGRYELFPGFTVAIYREGNRLLGRSSDGMSFPLVAESDSIFIMPQTGDTIEIVRDANGKVSGAAVDFRGEVIFAKRLASAETPVDGYWLGTLNVTDAQQLRLQLSVQSDASGSRCKLDSLDQSAYGIECSNAKFAGSDFSFEIPRVKGDYKGTLSADGKRLSGTWTQEKSWPLVLERQTTLLTPPTPKKKTIEPALPPVGAAEMESVLRKDFDSLLKSGALAPGTGIGATIGVLRDGERRVFSLGAARPDSLFEIGSVTKTFTGLMLAQMVEQQQVTAEQPVRTLMAPVVPESSGAEISLLDLVTHRSGLPRMPANFAPANPLNPYADYSVDRLYAYLTEQGLARPAGAPAAYSNLGMGLLGQALANRVESDYPTLVRQLVTAPLCMTDTVVQLDEARKARFIQGHTHDRKPQGPWDLDALAGAGAIRSTAEDMLKYLAAQLQPAPCERAAKSPNAKTLAAAIKRSQTLQGDFAPGRKIAYGWMFNSESGSYWHNGKTGGYSSFAFFNPQQRYAAIVLLNLAAAPDDLLDSLGDHVERRFAGKRVVKFE